MFVFPRYLWWTLFGSSRALKSPMTIYWNAGWSHLCHSLNGSIELNDQERSFSTCIELECCYPMWMDLDFDGTVGNSAVDHKSDTTNMRFCPKSAPMRSSSTFWVHFVQISALAQVSERPRMPYLIFKSWFMSGSFVGHASGHTYNPSLWCVAGLWNSVCFDDSVLQAPSAIHLIQRV